MPCTLFGSAQAARINVAIVFETTHRRNLVCGHKIGYNNSDVWKNKQNQAEQTNRSISYTVGKKHIHIIPGARYVIMTQQWKSASIAQPRYDMITAPSGLFFTDLSPSRDRGRLTGQIFHSDATTRTSLPFCKI